MKRRAFLGISAAAAAASSPALAAASMPMTTLGRSGLKVSRFCLGGYHMAVGGEENAVRIIHRAVELGVTFFDSANHYHQGRSDEIYGKALEGGRRKRVVLMSKAQIRTREGAMRQLEETLKRMRTDYLDLWQCHEVSTQEEVDRILRPGGALEAFVDAKKQGKVRHIGFTGHADPAVHARLLESFDGWETVQHPVNLIDPHYLSFIGTFLPKARGRKLGVLAMKSNGMGSIAKHGIATVAECLRFTLSQDVDTLVSGVETLAQLEENVAVVKSMRKMTPPELEALLARTAKGPVGPQVEGYKRKA